MIAALTSHWAHLYIMISLHLGEIIVLTGPESLAMLDRHLPL